MTNYRLFLLSFAAAAWILLSGFNLPSESEKPVIDPQHTIAELKPADAENAGKPQETKKAAKTRRKKPIPTISADNPKPAEPDDPLDLSVPFKSSENGDLEKKWAVPNGAVNIFSTETKKKPGPLELEGGFLMSPEPQAEKRKSVDGAGIIINIKP